MLMRLNATKLEAEKKAVPEIKPAKSKTELLKGGELWQLCT